MGKVKTEPKPIELPKDVPEYMADAWFGCMHWAIGEEEIVEAFRKESGLTWKPGKTPLDQMIDKATGADRDFIEKFVQWAHKNIWGGV